MRVIWAVLALVLLAGCSHEPPAYESRYTPPPAAPENTLVAVIGDSYTAGTEQGGARGSGWPAITERELRAQGWPVVFRVAAQNGAGYAAGSGNGTRFTNLVPQAVQGAKLVVLFGSRNDGKVPSGPEVPDAIRATLAQVKDLAPGADVLVIGPPWVTGPPTTRILEIRDALRTEALAAGATFVDPIEQGWFVDRMNLIGTDGVHPTQEGHAYLAEKIEPLIADELDRLEAAA